MLDPLNSGHPQSGLSDVPTKEAVIRDLLVSAVRPDVGQPFRERMTDTGVQFSSLERVVGRVGQRMGSVWGLGAGVSQKQIVSSNKEIFLENLECAFSAPYSTDRVASGYLGRCECRRRILT